MRRLLCILLSVLLVSTTTFAQSKQKKGTQPTEKAADAPQTPKMKKDGTPDMRHKANKEGAKKEAAQPAQKLKKDGTPDMRYKANREAAKKK